MYQISYSFFPQKCYYLDLKNVLQHSPTPNSMQKIEPKPSCHIYTVKTPALMNTKQLVRYGNQDTCVNSLLANNLRNKINWDGESAQENDDYREYLQFTRYKS